MNSETLDYNRRQYLRKHHIAYIVGSENRESLNGFEEWISDLFSEELSDRTKYYLHGFNEVVGDCPVYQKTFWIEAPVKNYLPEEKLFLAMMTWNMRERYNSTLAEYKNNDRTANVDKKIYYNDETQEYESFYEVNMYEKNQLIESRPIVGHSLIYAEDCADNWINGVIK